jgi:S1/P1 Nuclease
VKTLILLSWAVLSFVGHRQALAWGPPGHETVGAIADALIVGTNAEKAVHKILGKGAPLEHAALWADCAKGVTKTKATGIFKYTVDPIYTECKPFETAAGQKAMVSFVKRNWDACHPAAGEEVCHKQYHYADVAVERNSYDRADVGTSDHDVVSAVKAAVAVLQGGSSSAPISITSKKEALRLLAHYVGDIHQPLHVGAIYLSTSGTEVDPDHTTVDLAAKTEGGNQLFIAPKHQLHHEWDTIANAIQMPQYKNEGVTAAKAVALTSGTVDTWPVQWATESVLASHTAFAGLTFGAEANAGKSTQSWPTTEPANYTATREAIQKEQLNKAGARLAQLLEALYP